MRGGDAQPAPARNLLVTAAPGPARARTPTALPVSLLGRFPRRHGLPRHAGVSTPHAPGQPTHPLVAGLVQRAQGAGSGGSRASPANTPSQHPGHAVPGHCSMFGHSHHGLPRFGYQHDFYYTSPARRPQAGRSASTRPSRTNERPQGAAHPAACAAQPSRFRAPTKPRGRSHHSGLLSPSIFR